MIFSKLEVGAYFLAAVLAGWLLYPNEYTRGLMLRQTGDRSEAISFFRDYLARHPYHKGATMALVAAYEAAGRPEEGIQPLTAFYRGRRGDLETGKALLDLFERCGMRKRARAFRWELIEDLKSLAAVPQEPLERMLYSAFQEAAARQDDETTYRALTELAQLSTDSGGYRNEMLRLLMARRQLDRALELLGEAVKRAPLNMDIRRTVVRIHRLREDRDAAFRELSAGLALSPRHVGLLGDRASLLAETGRWAEAEADYRSLARLEPQEDAWVRERARCLTKQGKFDEGVRLYETLIARKPGDKQRWWDVVYILADEGFHLKAAQRLDRMQKRFGEDQDVLNAMIHQYQLAGRPDMAIRALEERVAAHPSDAGRLRQLIDLLLADEKFDEAGRRYRELLALRPTDRDVRPELAYVEETRGDLRSAVLALEDHLRIFPDDAKAMDKLVSLYVELNERPKAIEILRGYFKP